MSRAVRYRLGSVSAVLCILAASAKPLRADEVRLADGRVLVGIVVERGDMLDIQTRNDGVVTVLRDQVVARRTDAELRKELLRLARGRKNDAFSNLQLAKTALGWSLTKDLWRYLDRSWTALEREPSASQERRLREFLAGLEPELLPARDQLQDAEARVRALLGQVRPGVRPVRVQAILEDVARMKDKDADATLRTLARRGLLNQQRVFAAEALLRREAAGNDTFVYRTAILDPDPKARKGIAEVIGRQKDPTAAVHYLAPGFLHDLPVIRMRTAKAYTDIGHSSAVPILAYVGPLAGTPRAAANGGIGVRGSMSVLKQRSYIRDFDVEIAQAAAVANPVVDTVQTGVVLDVTVAAVVSQRVQIAMSYRSALSRLVGADPGPAPDRWHDWLAERDPAAAELVTRWKLEPTGKSGTDAKSDGAR